jgi:hypothetical protein
VTIRSRGRLGIDAGVSPCTAPPSRPCIAAHNPLNVGSAVHVLRSTSVVSRAGSIVQKRPGHLPHQRPVGGAPPPGSPGWSGRHRGRW